jgi:hypothetical protein
MTRRKSRYDIPVKFLIQVGDDPEPAELGSAGIPYPYNAITAVPRLLRELADALEARTRDDSKR